ncbi:BCLAF1 and THRAP3 family member 3 [Chaetodon trifascialis]|uniref:BCLAF1 and THRAP3 family member 3 n=1 Tax=Chaetodon trifascialis TaxID=109706 RepID=UPI003995ECA9
MSKPRSRSPHYRRLPWEETDFDPYKVLAELDGDHLDRSHSPREHPEEHLDYFREDVHSEGHRRSPPFSDDRHFRHKHHPNQEQFDRRRLSPHHDVMGYDERSLSPRRDGGGEGDRRRGGFREHLQSFENRRRSPHSPLKLTREKLPPTPRSHSDHQQSEPGMGWRREEQGRGRGRFRERSPGARSDDQREGAGRERGRRNTQGPNRDRRREDSYQERNLPAKRQRREMEDSSYSGYRNEEDFGEQRYSMDTPRDRFGGDTEGTVPHGDIRHSGPVIIEHDHGFTDSRELSRWDQFDRRRDPDFDRQRSPRPKSSSQERFRTSDGRSDDWKASRGRHFQDNWRDSSYREIRKSPTPQDRPNPVRYSNRDGPVSHRGRGGPRPERGRASHGQGGRTGPHRKQPRLQQSSHGYQGLPHEEQGLGYQPFSEEGYEDPIEGKADWAEDTRPQQWKHDRPGNLARHLDLDPKMPRQRMCGWNDPKNDNVTAVAEETLTIKVDMSRPVNQKSSLCYSSDRQLSLDLVNVGRQRLDFLPMMEHSGTYQETAVHTGTFAQEIITLVHQVKEQYFRDPGVTLNERFSASQKSSYAEDEAEELTLDQRFSSKRGFSLNMNSLLDDDDEPLFPRLGPLQPVRGPGDLRHDLERRRQERLEGVQVTISGNSMPQHPLGAASESGLDYRDNMALMDDQGLSNWPEEQSGRREGNMGPRRGASYRQNSQRRVGRFGNRLGPARRQNNRNNPAGQNW